MKLRAQSYVYMYVFAYIDKCTAHILAMYIMAYVAFFCTSISPVCA